MIARFGDLGRSVAGPELFRLPGHPSPHRSSDHAVFDGRPERGTGPVDRARRARLSTATGNRSCRWSQNDDGTTREYAAGEYVFHPTHGHVHFADYAFYRLYEVAAGRRRGDPGGRRREGQLLPDRFGPVRRQPARGPAAAGLCPAANDTRKASRSAGPTSTRRTWTTSGSTSRTCRRRVLVRDGCRSVRQFAGSGRNQQRRSDTKSCWASPSTRRTNWTRPSINELRLGTGDKHLSQLSIHKPGDVDTFRWVAAADGTVDVDLSFDRAQGDIDLYVWGTERRAKSNCCSRPTEGNGETYRRCRSRRQDLFRSSSRT